MEEDQQIERKNSGTAMRTMSLLDLNFRSLRLGDSENGSSPREDVRSSNNKSKDEIKHPRVINMDEVAWHDTADSCWVVIHDFVYDCTELLQRHPGGYDVILEYAGRDATLAFIGTGHSSMARQSLEKYLIEDSSTKSSGKN